MILLPYSLELFAAHFLFFRSHGLRQFLFSLFLRIVRAGFFVTFNSFCVWVLSIQFSVFSTLNLYLFPLTSTFFVIWMRCTLLNFSRAQAFFFHFAIGVYHSTGWAVFTIKHHFIICIQFGFYIFFSSATMPFICSRCYLCMAETLRIFNEARRKKNKQERKVKREERSKNKTIPK